MPRELLGSAAVRGENCWDRPQYRAQPAETGRKGGANAVPARGGERSGVGHSPGSRRGVGHGLSGLATRATPTSRPHGVEGGPRWGAPAVSRRGASRWPRRISRDALSRPRGPVGWFEALYGGGGVREYRTLDY